METMTPQMSPQALMNHLEVPSAPLRVPRHGQGPLLDDEARHAQAWRADAVLYALSALAPGVDPQQRARVAFQVLRASWGDQAPERRALLARVAAVLLRTLETGAALEVLMALRRARANHQHTTRAVVGFILDHPALEALAVARRPTLAAALEHALGRDVARGCARRIAEGVDEPYLRRNLWRFTARPERARAVIPWLFGLGPTPEGPEALTCGGPVVQIEPPGEERPRTVTATNRGAAAATLVHLYRGGATPALEEALEAQLQEAAAALPRFGGRLAVVLDASASTRGYGDREWCCVAQSVALARALALAAERAEILCVGGQGAMPIPDGPTDLASAVLEAAAGAPDVIAVLTDGYENALPGDLAAVAEALPRAGVHAPVVICHSMFAGSDNLDQRRPAPGLDELEFWHQDDFRAVAWGLLVRARGGEGFLLDALKMELERLERAWLEVTP